MKNSWPLQEAKNQFSRVVESALTQGPQTVTRHGASAVVVVSVADFQQGKPRRNNILELFGPVRGLNLTSMRDRSLPRKVTL